MANPLPRPVIAKAAEILGTHYTHSQLDRLFWQQNAPGETPSGNKVDKCIQWLDRMGEDATVDATTALGGLLHEFMEKEVTEPSWSWDNSFLKKRQAERDELAAFLEKNGLAYFPGGHVRKIGLASPARSLEQLLRARDLSAIEEEFHRALKNAEADPPAALTAACSLIEALCKTYLHDKRLPLPKDQSIQDLWKAVQKDLRLDPASKVDEDIKRILGGLSAVVSGIGALRTHAGSAHGRGPTRYTLHPRHARLAIHAAHTLATFVLETWDQNTVQQAGG